MRNQRRLILTLLVLVVVLARVLFGFWAGEWPIGLPSLPGVTERQPPPPPTDCIKDPAQLPAPTAADGTALNYVHTCGSRLFDSAGREVRITGINWFGMETGTYAPHGLWTRNWKTILDQIAQLGYNAIRLPLSNDALVPGQKPQGINYDINPDLQGLTSLEVLDTIVKGAGERGLRVVLDRHRPTSEAQSDLWYTQQVSEERWISDWVTLAARYKGNDTVIGVDLHNEPKGAATWGTGDPGTDWRAASEKAGNAILGANPYLLIVVQGIEQYDGDWYWWGGNLMGARDHPVKLKLPGRLMYSAHDYGPGVYDQGWFNVPDFPRNLPGVWRSHWGYLIDDGIAPVLLGEFGGKSVSNDAEGVWQRALLDYMRQHDASYFAWSLNPDSSDTGGVLGYDWLTVVADKEQLYRAYMAPPIVDSRGAHFGAAEPLEVLYRANDTTPQTTNISFSLQLIDHSGQTVDLSQVELRYWFTQGAGRADPVAEVDYAGVGKDRVKTEFVPTTQGGMDHYLRISFPAQGTQMPAYGSSGDLILRIHAADWSQNDQTNDYSFSPEDTGYKSSEKVTLYVDGKLVWGKEP